ncbi:MAG: hypothetical protein OEV43_07855 [Coriobacteriia bacterium]|nr:hypothetical protein [Coriobacteriia bacterium]
MSDSPAAVASLGAAYTLTTLGLGWVVLFPLRQRLGIVGYHLASYPTGLLAWPVVACVSSLVGQPFGVETVFFGVLPYLFFGLLFARSLAPVSKSGGESVWPRESRAVASYVIWGVGICGIAAVVQGTGATAVGYDSVFHYAAWGSWLDLTGKIGAEIAGAYGALIPSAIAASRVFGVGWLASPWPILALHVVAIVGVGVREATRGLARVWRIAIPAITVALMVASAPFLAHSIYLHSHMISAAYLALALMALRHAFVPIQPPFAEDAVFAWCFVAGVATAGLALARPDGLAYALVPLAVAVVARLHGPRPARTLTAFLVPLLAFLGLFYGTAFLETRGWGGDKLTAKTAAAVIVALAIVGIAGAFLDRIPHAGPWLASRRHALLAATVLNAVALIGLFLVRTEELRATTTIMFGNLTEHGGYGSLWVVAAAMIVLSVAWARVWRPDTWSLLLLFAIGQFFAVAVVVHGLGHPGRLSPADSFARVAFHVVPLVFWYGGSIAAGLTRAWHESRDAEEGR